MSEAPDVIHVSRNEVIGYGTARRPLEMNVNNNWMVRWEDVKTVSVQGRCYEVITALNRGIRCLDLDTLDVVVLELE